MESQGTDSAAGKPDVGISRAGKSRGPAGGNLAGLPTQKPAAPAFAATWSLCCGVRFLEGSTRWT